ncbi:MAG: flavin reductase [archaeon]|nr:flavin reductase [archaeon]
MNKIFKESFMFFFIVLILLQNIQCHTQLQLISDGIYNIGVNDKNIKIFEGQYPVNGMTYNSYLIKDKNELAVIDTVDRKYLNEWMKSIEKLSREINPKYLIIQHIESNYITNIDEFLKKYPNAKIVFSKKAYEMKKELFNTEIENNKIIIKEGNTLEIGNHLLSFIDLSLMHWPESFMTYDSLSKTLFSSDLFGKFNLSEDEEWEDEGRRYYINILGKYGDQIQRILSKISKLEIKTICPTFGEILKEDINYYLNKYSIWSSYSPEEEGILIIFTSIYGNTKEAVDELSETLRKEGAPKIVIKDLNKIAVSYLISEAFKFPKIILASFSYNSELFSSMRNFILHLTDRNFQLRKIGFIENTSFGSQSINIMKELLKNSKVFFLQNSISIKDTLTEENKKQIEAMSKELLSDNIEKGEIAKMDLTSLYNIGYGLYVITSNDGEKDNGFIGNSVIQLTSKPLRIGVTINKDNYSHTVILNTKKMNLNILTTEAPFDLIKHFGFQSGRTVDKFKECPFSFKRTMNGLIYLTENINSVISLSVIEYIDLGTHGMFICDVNEAIVFNRIDTMTYAYYQSCVKPKKNGETGYVCKVCGYVYKGETLPNDYICPICKHCADDFEKIKVKRFLAKESK